ncbi:putative bifunctional diguanylate cyclase/phosphodiesterase [Hydrogenimonas sp.]
MHRLLHRILKKSGLSPDSPPDPQKWRDFLERVERSFVSSDEDRYLLERSLEISSREMEELLEASKESYQQKLTTLIKAIPDLIFYVDEEGRFIDVLSQGREETLYLPREEVQGHRIGDIFPAKQARIFMDGIGRALASDRLQIENYALRMDGERYYFEARILPARGVLEKGKRTLLCIVRDMTAQKRYTEYLGVIKKIFEDATEGIFIASVDGDRIDVNDAFCKMLGVEPSELSDYRLDGFKAFLDSRTLGQLRRSIVREGSFRGEVKIHRKGGGELPVWLTFDTVYDERGDATYWVAMLTDISELEASTERLRYTATHDSLTGLPNRMLLFEKLGDALKKSKRRHTKGALLFIDLDNFKEINDTDGHRAGDAVLRECTNRVKSIIRESDTFGRLGGDEFLLILEEVSDTDAPMHVAQKIIDRLNEPFVVGDESFDLGASIGIALFPDDGFGVEELVQFADMAMYWAKERGKNRFHYYSRRLDESVRRHYMIEKALKEALREGQFHLLYQPQLSLRTGEVTGVEALVRVEGSVIGLISPAEFIPIAEESDLILKIGRWVFEEVCRQMAAWRETGVDGLRVAINLSRRQLRDEGWVPFVRETLSRYDIAHESIEFEITETTFMHSKEAGYRTIQRLQRMGFRFSIDDFGTGYSSLSNLKHFTVDKLKIDRSFVADMPESDSDLAIVQASVALGHALGLGVIAEGVETDRQVEMLRNIGCDEIQGYWYNRPLQPDAIPPLLGSAT